MHLIKLAVGIDNPEQLKQRQDYFTRSWRGQSVHMVSTRQFPKLAPEIIGQGSLYWVIKGTIALRQSVAHIEKVVDEDGQSMTVIMLAPDHITVQPTPRRPFQGWRYLKAEDAPPDLNPAHRDVDPALLKELSALGLA